MLISKLEFLGISRQSISNFHMLLLQTEVTEVLAFVENKIYSIGSGMHDRTEPSKSRYCGWDSRIFVFPAPFSPPLPRGML